MSACFCHTCKDNLQYCSPSWAGWRNLLRVHRIGFQCLFHSNTICSENVPLGKYCHTASNCLHIYILGTYGHVRSHSGRQPAAAKNPPLNSSTGVVPVSRISLTLWLPLLIRCAFGTTSFISLANCFSLLDGSRLVVTHTLGSLTPACPYSSSIELLCLAVSSSSSST